MKLIDIMVILMLKDQFEWEHGNLLLAYLTIHK